jgi:hypothetical protein
MRWVDMSHHTCFVFWKRTIGIQWTGGWVDASTYLNAVTKTKTFTPPGIELKFSKYSAHHFHLLGKTDSSFFCSDGIHLPKNVRSYPTNCNFEQLWTTRMRTYKNKKMTRRKWNYYLCYQPLSLLIFLSDDTMSCIRKKHVFSIFKVWWLKHWLVSVFTTLQCEVFQGMTDGSTINRKPDQ